ncbi:MAG TPA: Mur ligase family protein [Acidobacteriota bacterium]|nr:Mur ligase family protein [Acidobacteriota bacterium]
MKVHFISIGGAAMHNLALALHKKGVHVTGSDDEIFEPSRSRLAAAGLLPKHEGWDASRITADLEAVILGMHARADNPELLAAQKLNLRIYSFPEYLFEQTKQKQRVVIGGSHGKTTITSMILHVLHSLGSTFDYLVGAQIEGFETMVGLSDNSETAVFEGDEYLSSALDRRPKFHLYRPHIGVISGIAWDHANVFPSPDVYARQFRLFVESFEKGGQLIFFGEDPELSAIAASARDDLGKTSYETHPYEVRDGQFHLLTGSESIPLQIFGKHNMQNLSAAKAVCLQLGVSADDFYACIRSFKGAARRLQTLSKVRNTCVFLDFAHSPSKVAATTAAVKELFPHRRLVACLELHTFSSLSPDFIREYRSTLDFADEPIVFVDPEAVQQKRLPPLSKAQIQEAFANQNLLVFSDKDELLLHLSIQSWDDSNLLLMSSGSFSGVDVKSLAQQLVT